jgi:hypothetical protein
MYFTLDEETKAHSPGHIVSQLGMTGWETESFPDTLLIPILILD